MITGPAEFVVRDADAQSAREILRDLGTSLESDAASDHET